ncbi:MAG: hypothetical protein K0S32_4247 [Bacteroidetes bacterium]|nr:hypothetical protein [Bacteroidota bacterium]
MTETQVWNHFSKISDKLIAILESKTRDYSAYDELSETFTSYSEYLFPEFTGDENGKYILIITCDGNRKGIPFAEKLVEAAPVFDKWSIQKYRQPGGISQLNFNGLEYPENDIRIKYDKVDGLYDIDIFIKDYDKDDNRYESLAFLYLDHFIGEYNVMTKINTVGFGKLKSSAEKISLRQLHDLINNQE